jgi:hypothetical protein
MPDADQFNRMYLIKNVRLLRATYQIRLLAFFAFDKGNQLVLRVPSSCTFDEPLMDLIAKCDGRVIREDY